MAFDYKKEYKEFYMPKNKPGIVNVPSMNYIAVRGQGDPNVEDGEYKQSIGLLYGPFTIFLIKSSIYFFTNRRIIKGHTTTLTNQFGKKTRRKYMGEKRILYHGNQIEMFERS